MRAGVKNITPLLTSQRFSQTRCQFNHKCSENGGNVMKYIYEINRLHKLIDAKIVFIA